MADEPLNHTAMKTKFTELQESYRLANVFVPSSMKDILHLVLRRLPTPSVGDISFNDA